MWNLTYKTSVSLNGNSVSFRTKDMWFKIFESHANACTNAPRCLSKEPLQTNITEYRTHFIVGACACCLNILWADITVLNMRLQNNFWNYRTSFVVATCLTLEYSGHRYHYNWHSTEEHFLLRTVSYRYVQEHERWRVHIYIDICASSVHTYALVVRYMYCVCINLCMYTPFEMDPSACKLRFDAPAFRVRFLSFWSASSAWSWIGHGFRVASWISQIEQRK